MTSERAAVLAAGNITQRICYMRNVTVNADLSAGPYGHVMTSMRHEMRAKC
jgi:hypothetical protein